jgi:hypothetical protein
MVCDPACPRCRWRLWSAALAVVMGLNGCQKAPEIAHYQVPKEQALNPSVAQSEPPGPDGASDAAGDSNANGVNAESSPSDRMLAAIATHGDSAWTFKLTGPIESVDKHAAEFTSLLKSVKFSDQAGEQPQWKLPAGWTQAAGTSAMRLATITIPDEQPPLEITVGMIPWPAAENDQRLLMNMNRWRGQMQLKPTDAAGLAENMQSLKVAGGQVMLVDLKGKFKAGSMQPPFAAAAGGGGQLPPGHPPMADSLPTGHPPMTDTLPAGHPPVADSLPAGHPPMSNPAAEQDAASAVDLPFTFTAPSGWKAAALPTFSVAAFAVSENSPRPEVTITPLPESAAGIAANVNRWRGQLGLPEASKDELAAQAKPYKVDGQPGNWVSLQGPEGANPRRAIVAVVVPHDGVNWIFALKADTAVADSQQANFKTFMESVKFRAAN